MASSLKLPICSFDAKTGVLCPKCEEKLEKGIISQTDVEVSMKLIKLVSKFPSLDKVTLKKAMDVGDAIVLVLGSGDLARLRGERGLFTALRKALGKRVWAVEEDAPNRRLIEELVYPARIMSMNIVWLPDGTKLTKAIIPGRRTEKFPVNLDQVERIFKAVKGIDLKIEFERH